MAGRYSVRPTGGGPHPSPELPRRVYRITSLVSGLFGLALLIAVPIVLGTVFGNPINRLPTGVDTVREYIDRRYVPAEVAIGLLSLILWLVWLQYVWALVWEVAVVGPAAARGGVARAAPLAPALIRSLASTVVSGLFAATVVVGSPSLSALGSHLMAQPPPLAADISGGRAPADPAEASTLTSSTVATHIVADGESLWSLAGGNDLTVRRILDLNEHRIRSAVDIRPGMELVVPAELTERRIEPTGADRDLSPVGDHAGGEAAGGVTDHQHVVVEDDNLWTIAAGRLEAGKGGRASNQEIAYQVQAMVEANPEVIEDPDLIYPGEVIELPDGLRMGEPSPAPQGRAAGAGHLDGTNQAADANTGADNGGPIVAGARTPTSGQEGEPADDQGRPRGHGLYADHREAIGVVEGPAADVEPRSRASAPAPARLVVGTLASATGFALLLRRLRRRRSARFGEGRTAADLSRLDSAGAESRLTGNADPHLLAWAAAGLNQLGARCSRHDAPVAVRVISTSSHDGTDCGMTVIWASEPPPPVEGWERTGPSTWFRRYDETIEVGDDLGVPALPGLLPIGRTTDGNGELLLVNLAAYGTMAVGGAQARIDAALRAVVFEAATTGWVSGIEATVVGFQSLVDDTALEHVIRIGEQAALDKARAVVGQYQAENATPLDLEVFVVDALSPRLDTWLELARPHSGVAVVLRGAVKSSRLGAELTIDESGHGRFDPLAIPLTVTGMSADDVAAANLLVEQITAEPAAPSSIVRAPADIVADRAGVGRDHGFGADRPGPGDDGATVAASEDPVTIKVLGRTRCDELPTLAGRALSLVTFLCAQPGRRASKQEIVEAVWCGREVPDRQFMRVVSIARSHLGPSRLPKQTAADGPLLVRNVETDLDRLQQLVLQARNAPVEREASLLREAVGLVTGPPFEGTSTEWAHQSGLVGHVEELIESVTLRAVDALVDAGRKSEVRMVVETGLRALPANEPIYRSYLRLFQGGSPDTVDAIVRHLERSQSFLHPTDEPAVSPETSALVASLTGSVAKPVSGSAP